MEREEIVKELFLVVRHNSYKLNKVFDKSFSGMYSVLQLLSFQDNGLLAGDIAKTLEMNTSQVAFILRNLRSKKFIEISFDKDDKRKKYIFITEEGKQRVKKEEMNYFGSFMEAFKELSNEELNSLLEIFKKLGS